MNLIERLRRIVSIWLTCKNAYALYLNKFLGLPVSEIVLWNGARFTVDNINNNLGTILEVFSAQEYRDLSLIPRNTEAIIIDIGANIGTVSVLAAQKLPKARIYAFEPEKRNIELLRANIELNNLAQRVEVFDTAVCGTSGVRQLSVAGVSSGKNSLSYDVSAEAAVPVLCTTLQAIFAEHSLTACHCLKIDCEGAEYELLYATPVDVLSKIHMMIIEWHKVQGHSLTELTQFLESHGFAVEHSQRFASMFTARRA